MVGRGYRVLRVGRTPIVVRSAVGADAEILVELWSQVLRKGTYADQLADVSLVLDEVEGRDDREVVVAEYDGVVVGAVYLRSATVTPINKEPLVMAVSPHVLPAYRRHGVGHALVEAAVEFAEQRGIGYVGTAALSASRDSNRFLARLAFTTQAVLRINTTSAVRAKLTPRGSGSQHRPVRKVLAARRTLRRGHSRDPD